jgi:FkbM family methyltransferase
VERESIGNFSDTARRTCTNPTVNCFNLFVLVHFAEKRNGYFVEFGATDGRALSNTFLLEDDYQWTGILAEPARCWHSALTKNRKSAIDLRCVWARSGEQLDFNETESAELSTINSFSDLGLHASDRSKGTRYTVETVSPSDLLAHHLAPYEIDYLSIDTEGSEFEILSPFDFSSYDIRLITVEHNYNLRREQIFSLLTSQGYRRLFQEFSDLDIGMSGQR